LDRLPDVVALPPGATAVASPAGTIVVPATADPRTVVALQFIVAQIGKPYLWGGTGPQAYDCSGLMLRAFQSAGVRTMPRVSQAQQIWATPVAGTDIQPGDLVFFGRPAYHVGVYIGGGLMIDAPYTGAHVRVDHVWSSVSGYGRVVW
ncbi:MAG: C40 family peptidase, partial [Actinobacteria bacterium]|nr:C40 family peptidase [Actinomycetota bacterium]